MSSGFIGAPCVVCGRAVIDPLKDNHPRKVRRGHKRQRAWVVAVEGGTQGGEEEEEDRGDVAKRIERTFVEACLPGTKPYVEALGDFVRSALDAYVRGYGLTALQLELQARKDAGSRNLKQDELELRMVWLTLVYKTLRAIAFPSRGSKAIRESYDRLDDFVKNIVQAAREGYDMKRLQLEQSLLGGSDKPRTPTESAILNQSTRLVFLTLSIAKAMGGEGPTPKMPESS